jgi:hypothetical protein
MRRRPRPIQARAPQKADANRCSLNDLGDDLIVMVIELLYGDSPDSLDRVALVSSYYYEAARHRQLRKVRLTIGTDNGELEKKISRLRAANHISATRHVSIHDDLEHDSIQDEADETQRAAQHLIVLFLQDIDGLADVEWHTRMAPYSKPGLPTELLEALRRRPRVRLGLEVNSWRQGDLQEPSEALLQYTTPLEGFLNLTSLGIQFQYYHELRARGMFKATRSLLLSCPNIRRLRLNIALPQGGCVPRGWKINYLGLGFVAGDCISALEELDLREVDIGPTSPPFFYTGEFLGYEGDGSEMDVWASFDWSRLKRLATDDIEFAMALAPQLTALEEVAFCKVVDTQLSSGSPQPDLGMQFRAFYEQLPVALEVVEIPSVEVVGTLAVVRHAAKLRRLNIFNEKGLDKSPPKNDVVALGEIADKCTLVEELSLDVERDGEWPYDLFNVLAKFPRLKALELRFAYYSSDRNGVLEPFLTAGAASAISEYIHSRRPSHLAPIRQITASTGHREFPFLGPMQFGYRGLGVDFFSGARDQHGDSFECELRQGAYATSCGYLTEEENECLRGGGEIPATRRGDYVRRARDGPFFFEVADYPREEAAREAAREAAAPRKRRSVLRQLFRR